MGIAVLNKDEGSVVCKYIQNAISAIQCFLNNRLSHKELWNVET